MSRLWLKPVGDPPTSVKSSKFVECIDNTDAVDYLVIGRTYEVVSEGQGYHPEPYYILRGVDSFWYQSRFKVVKGDPPHSEAPAAETSVAEPTEPPFDFDAYNGVRKT